MEKAPVEKSEVVGLWKILAKRRGRPGYTEALVMASDKEEAFKIFDQNRMEREDFRKKYGPGWRAEKVKALRRVTQWNTDS